jgi:hypothetical protein
MLPRQPLRFLLAEASGIAVTAKAYTPTGARVVSFSL